MRYVLVLVLFLWVTSAIANDKHLLQRLELEIKVESILDKSYKRADAKIRETLKKTTLWARYLKARREFADTVKQVKYGGCSVMAEYTVWHIPAKHEMSRHCGNIARIQYYDMRELHGLLTRLRRKYTDELYRRDAKAQLQSLKKGLTDQLQRFLEKVYKKVPKPAGHST